MSLQAVGDDGALKPPRASLRGRTHVDQYDVNGFYVKAHNRYDHTTKRTVEMDPDVAAQIEKLIASAALVGTPIDSMGAFVRDSMYHNMERIKRLIADPVQIQLLGEAAEDYRRLAQADSITRDIENKKAIINGARDGLDAALAAKDDAMVDQLLDLYEPMVERLREPYGEQLDEIVSGARDRRKK